jgi:cytochrome c biogenesis protein CcmG/thiol:disulfide interchange protein DsbE
MKQMLKLSFIVLFSALTSLGASAQEKQSLPDLVLKDMDGNNVNVQDYGKSGKVTIISFWATWCGPCKKELNNLNDLYDDWKKKYNVQIIAVTTDNARNTPKVKPYVDGQGWEFEVLLDINEDLKRALNAPNIPFTIVVDKNGKIVYSHNGYVEGDEVSLEEKLKTL